MTDSPPALVVFLNELRKSIRALFLTIIGSTVLVFFLAPRLLDIVQGHLAEKLYFFSVAGPFLAHVKLALFGALYCLMPWIMSVFLKATGKPFQVTRLQLVLFTFFTCLLFYAGTLFCYFVTPAFWD